MNTVIGGNNIQPCERYDRIPTNIDHDKSIGKGIMSIVGCLNTISNDTTSCHIIGNHNSIPTGASKCIIIGDNIQLTEDCQLNEAIYLVVLRRSLSMNGEFVDIVERLAVVEEKFTDFGRKSQYVIICSWWSVSSCKTII